LPTQHGQDVVELLGHDDGDSDFASVAAAHRALIDQLVEEDDELMARYLEDGTDPSPQELHAPFEKALRAGHLIPILFVSAKTGAGVPQLLDALAKLAPNPAEGNPPPFYRGEPDQEPQAFAAQPDDALHVLAHVFKVVVDPFIGKVGVFRVHQGTIRKDAQLFVGSAKKRPSRWRTCTACKAKTMWRCPRWCRATLVRWPRWTRSSLTACCMTRTTKTTFTSSPWLFRSPCKAWRCRPSARVTSSACLKFAQA
jgi:translation elongation factor EF-G